MAARFASLQINGYHAEACNNKRDAVESNRIESNGKKEKKRSFTRRTTLAEFFLATLEKEREQRERGTERDFFFFFFHVVKRGSIPGKLLVIPLISI